MTGAIYVAIGLVVASIALYILIKVEPPWDDTPTFGDFIATIGICLCLLAIGTAAWPLVLVVGGLWLVWRQIYGDDKVEEL